MSVIQAGPVRGTVAPHMNNEVRLVLGGYKPLATIEKGKDPIGYALAISMAGTGALVAEVGPTSDCPTGEVIIVRPINRPKIAQYKWLLEYGVAAKGIRNYHRQMGYLFGYSVADIEEFINAEFPCNCNKCRGTTDET